ncbi:ABC transporter substrate-binding protein [Natrinema longum]|uniref:Peptide ABC transporter substrate-binding protein n=1 Tax=Natrinema longum TaxID=370324 RepID=A0A8A2UC56_9EURY|nr:ABC transporter substrate-binding protein [Natrinema longum]MBZ6495626.1 peptide ABC transporter substrate-binding protein [Natrinema longum]QSW86411.1 peptide ABC transporter substrate-binding protein [Natrinema longum]
MRGSHSRRRVLGSIGVGIGSMAGCLTGSSDGAEVTVARPETSQDGNWGVYGGVIPYYTEVFEPLVRANAEMKPEPLLATDWKRMDEYTWRFDLREDVRFHNGAELTAETVVSSFETLIDHHEATGWINVEPDGVRALADHAVAFETTEPFPTFPGSISHSYFGIVHPDTDVDESAAIGTGPFRLADRDGDDVTLVPYDDHWRTTPTVDRLRFEVVSDATTRTEALEGAAADIALGPPRSAVSQLEAAAGTTVATQRAPHACFGAVNIYAEPTDDRTFRRGLAHAIDQERLVDTVLEGIGDPARGPISPEIPWAVHDDLPTHGPDRDRARDLVADSAYTGETLELLIDGDEPDDRTVAERLQHVFDEIGVDSEITSAESAAFRERFVGGEAHVTIVSFGSNSAASDYLIRAMFHSLGSDNRDLYEQEGTGVMNPGPEVDRLIEDGYQADSSEAKREAYGAVQRRVVDDAVVLPLYYREYVLAHETDIVAPQLHPIDKLIDFTESERRQ